MFKFEDIISENFSSYPEEVQEYMKKYTEELKEAIKEELINDFADKIKNADKNNDFFMEMLTEMLSNGFKGYNKMSLKTLINIYLERKTEKDLVTVLNNLKINN